MLGFGATGEVYDVTVLQHDCPGPAETAGAAAPQSLIGKQLCLKVCRFFSCVPHRLRQRRYGDAEAFLNDMCGNLLKHHTIMQQYCHGPTYILGSHVFGSILGVEGAQVPALLMDRAEQGSVAQQLQQQRRRPGLGWKQTQEVLSMVVLGLADMHDAGWAHLDIKPSNIVSSRCGTEPGGDTYTHYYLVDFGSSVRLGAADNLTFDVPSTHEVISPEWRNDNVVGYKADIWAVGALLLELRTGGALSDDLLRGLMRQSSHASTLAAMRQSAAYSHLTDDEWGCLTACLTYEHRDRPTADDLYEMSYFGVGAE